MRLMTVTAARGTAVPSITLSDSVSSRLAWNACLAFNRPGPAGTAPALGKDGADGAGALPVRPDEHEHAAHFEHAGHFDGAGQQEPWMTGTVGAAVGAFVGHTMSRYPVTPRGVLTVNLPLSVWIPNLYCESAESHLYCTI